MTKLYIKKNISNLPGWRTKRKIVVFESDDWGSIRMPSKNVFDRLKEEIDLKSNDYERYNQNDTLEGNEDLELLFDLLLSFKDKERNSCVFTAISVVANPNFERIRESHFTQYFYEPFIDTLEKYYPSEHVFSTWKKGFEEKIFVPQFHGREHLNVRAWMESLRNGHRDTLIAFNEGLWGFLQRDVESINVEYQAAFQLNSYDDIKDHSEILKEGLILFKQIHGYKARYFVPPNGPINNQLNKTLAENGIEFRSTAKIQQETIDYGKTRKVINWLGKRDKSGIIYITRNCFFEPSQPGKDWVDSCLNDIRIAFNCKKPAIISSHRVNYIGKLNPTNRDVGLRQLRILLTEVIKKWPDVEFLTSDQLGSIIKASVYK